MGHRPWREIKHKRDQMTTTTEQEHWEDALVALCKELDQTGQIDLYEYYSTADVLSTIELVVDTLNGAIDRLDSPTFAPSLPAWWRALLRLALSRVALEKQLTEAEALAHVADVVYSKQRDYGHGNIAKFGMTGIIIRTNDKYERLANLISKNRDPSNEPLVDTWVDLVGYSIIALMWIEGTFLLPLRARQQFDGDYQSDPTPSDLAAEIHDGYGDHHHVWLGDVTGPT